MKTIVLTALLAFAAAPLFASSADLTLTSDPPLPTVIRAGVRWFTGFAVHNAGPDVATNVVAIRDNRIWGNKFLGIDVGLDGPTPDGGNGTIAITQTSEFSRWLEVR